MSLRVLMTGAGSIARRHAVNLLVVRPGAEIVVVTRHPEQRLASWPAGVTAVSSFEEGMVMRPDAVMICSVSASHARELECVIRAGLPVFVEKPLLTSPADLALLESLVSQSHPASVVGCNLRFLPSLQQLKNALQEGVAGTLVRAHLEVGQWLPDWRPGRDLADSYSADAAAGGGVAFDLVHEIDAAVWLLGDLSLVAASGGKLSSLPVNAPDTTVALLRTRGRCPVTISLDYVSRRPVRRYVFVGDSGTLTWDYSLKQISLATAGEVQILTDKEEGFLMASTYEHELAEWLNAIERHVSPPTCALADSLPTARLMLRIQEAAA